MDEDKRKVIRNELVFLIENPAYLDEVTDWLIALTPQMVKDAVAELDATEV
jgi:hypothetical protein